ncbi:hypothetical protein [Rickettsiella massiliensis]
MRTNQAQPEPNCPTAAWLKAVLKAEIEPNACSIAVANEPDKVVQGLSFANGI